MLGLILAAALIASPPVIDPFCPTKALGGILSVEVFYDHRLPSGEPYTFFTSMLVLPGSYDLTNIQGHPVGAEWSTGVFCGRRGGLVFQDGFEAGGTEKWDWSTE